MFILIVARLYYTSVLYKPAFIFTHWTFIFGAYIRRLVLRNCIYAFVFVCIKATFVADGIIIQYVNISRASFKSVEIRLAD